MAVTYNYEVTYRKNAILNKMGLAEKGEVQKFVANTVLTLATPYVPFDEMELYEQPGRLVESGHVEGDEYDVVWRTPYARRLYYHPEYNFQGAPMRGAYWVDRMMRNGGSDKITQGANALVDRLAKARGIS